MTFFSPRLNFKPQRSPRRSVPAEKASTVILERNGGQILPLRPVPRDAPPWSEESLSPFVQGDREAPHQADAAHGFADLAATVPLGTTSTVPVSSIVNLRRPVTPATLGMAVIVYAEVVPSKSSSPGT